MMTRAQIITYATTKLGITDSAASTAAGTFLDMRHSMIWNDADWRQARVQEAVSIVAGTQDYALGSTFEFIKAARWDGRYEVPVVADQTAITKMPDLYDRAGPLVGVIPLARSSGVAQIRVIGVPQHAGTLLVIGKKKATALGTDDEPPLAGEDMVLCEFVLADLYEWLRQFSKAQHYLGKAGILLQKMRELESTQAAEMHQVIPYTQQLDGDAFGPDSRNPLG